MKIENLSWHPDCDKPQFMAQFEKPHVDELKIPQRSEVFTRVRAVAEANEAFCRTSVSPWVQAATNP